MLNRIGYKQILFRLDDTLNVLLMPISIDTVCHIYHIQTILLKLQPLYSRFPSSKYRISLNDHSFGVLTMSFTCFPTTIKTKIEEIHLHNEISEVVS